MTNSKTIFVLSLMALITTIGISTVPSAFASLEGDEVTVELVNATEGSRNAIVNSTEIEFNWGQTGDCGSPDESIDMNFTSNSIDIHINEFTGAFLFCDSGGIEINPLIFNISNLNWVNQPDGIVVGITNSTVPSLPTTFAVTGPNSVQINVTASFASESTTLSYELETFHNPVNVTKSWTHTDYNWDPVCDGSIENATGCFLDETTQIDYRPANINATAFPEDDVLADPLDQDTNGNYTAYAQVHKNKFKNTNPGAFYALTTAVVTSSLSSVTVDEIYDGCTESGEDLLKFVSKKPTRNVKVAVANSTGFVTELTDNIYDGIGGNVTANIDNATVNITDSEYLQEGNTVFVLVKFQDNLKNEAAPGNEFDEMCTNVESVTARIGDNSFVVDAEAALRITNQE